MSSFDLSTLQQDLARHRSDTTLLQPEKLAERMQALALTELIASIARARRTQSDWATLQQDATQLAQSCRAANQSQFDHLREELSHKRCSSAQLRQYFEAFTAYRPGMADFIHWSEETVDVLVRGVLEIDSNPQSSQLLESEMVHLEHTPTSVVLEMVDRAGFTPESHFYDIGSGLGQVAILVHLLTGAQASGIELDALFCEHAQQMAAKFGLHAVDFVNIDAREADYQRGDIFFLFTPFRGTLLQSVMARLHTVAAQRPITICTYGSCTQAVAQLPWLRSLDNHTDHEFKLAIFQAA